MPAQVNPKTFHVSASSIRAFKSCNVKWRLAYREGLRPATESEVLRVGTMWHLMHETYANAFSECREKASDWCVPDDIATASSYAMTTVIGVLNNRYKNAPSYIDMKAWALERQVLLTCFEAYLWRWQNDPVEFLHSELPFDLPIHNAIGLPLRTDEALRVGKIDHIIRWNGAVCALERKSTTRDIAPDSDYWSKSQKDTQVSMYALAMRDMREANLLPVKLKENERFGNTLYDVFRRPTIKPAMLSQDETKTLIETGTYSDHAFSVEQSGSTEQPVLRVNTAEAEIKVMKKGFAIRETLEMFSARLLQDIYANSDKYFQRKEIARTDADLSHFRREIYNVYQSQKTTAASGHYFENENECSNMGRCQYTKICYGPGHKAVCDGKTTPDGFARVFVDLTKEGAAIDAE